MARTSKNKAPTARPSEQKQKRLREELINRIESKENTDDSDSPSDDSDKPSQKKSRDNNNIASKVSTSSNRKSNSETKENNSEDSSDGEIEDQVKTTNVSRDPIGSTATTATDKACETLIINKANKTSKLSRTTNTTTQEVIKSRETKTSEGETEVNEKVSSFSKQDMSSNNMKKPNTNAYNTLDGYISVKKIPSSQPSKPNKKLKPSDLKDIDKAPEAPPIVYKTVTVAMATSEADFFEPKRKEFKAINDKVRQTYPFMDEQKAKGFEAVNAKIRRESASVGLNSMEATALKKFIRHQLFERVKFINEDLLTNSPEITEECFKCIGKNSDNREERKLTSTIQKIMRNCINQKRGYVTDLVLAKMEKYFLDNRMFPVEYLDLFRVGNDMSAVPEEVKNAWFMFLYDFCRFVSTQWRKALANIAASHHLQFKKLLSRSDEGLVMWIIKIRYNEVRDNVASGKLGYQKNENKGKDDKESKTQKRTGPQDQKTFMSEYVGLCHALMDRRSDVSSANAWQNWFFEAYKSTQMKKTEVEKVAYIVDPPEEDSENDDAESAPQNNGQDTNASVAHEIGPVTQRETV